MGKRWTKRYKHKTNLIGLTSSRKASRTNAYTERILLSDENVFSSWVRSRKRTLIVVYRETDRIMKKLPISVFACGGGRRRTLGQRSRLAFACSSR